MSSDKAPTPRASRPSTRRQQMMKQVHGVQRQRISVLSRSSIAAVSNNRGSLFDYIESGQQGRTKLYNNLKQTRQAARESRIATQFQKPFVVIPEGEHEDDNSPLNRDSSIIEQEPPKDPPGTLCHDAYAAPRDSEYGLSPPTPGERRMLRSADYRVSSVFFRFSEVDMEEQKRLLGEGAPAGTNNNLPRISDVDVRMSTIDLEEQKRILGNYTSTTSARPSDVRISTIDVEEQKRLISNFDDMKMESITEELEVAEKEEQEEIDDEETMIQVAPGLCLPVVRESVTIRAAISGKIAVLECLQCDEELFCSAEAAVMLCGHCWTFNPVQPPNTDLRTLPKEQLFIDVGVRPDVVMNAVREAEETATRLDP